MSSEMVTLLLGVQGGSEESFACLYAVTNPVLVRYLRVVSDADPASTALSTWSTLLHDIPVLVADDDDDWLELAIGAARASALAPGTIRCDVSPTSAPTPAVPARTVDGPERDRIDPIDAGVAALRACGPAVAEVLAMGVVAGLGRDSIARITGQQPIDVLALVLEGQTRLALPLERLISMMRVSATPAEVGDLAAVLPLFAAQSHSPGPTADVVPAGKPPVVDLLAWDSPALATPTMAPAHDAQVITPPRWARVGVGAAAWTMAVGGVAAAVGMIGVIPAAIHSIFGDGGNGPVIAAHAPLRPGGPLPGGNGGAGTQPGPSVSTPIPPGPGPATGPGVPAAGFVVPVSGPVEPATGTVGTSASNGGDVVIFASDAVFVTSTRALVAPAVLTSSVLSPQSVPSAPSASGVTAPASAPTPEPRSVDTKSTKAAGESHGTRIEHPKHTGPAEGHAKSSPKGHAKASPKGHAKTNPKGHAKSSAKGHAKSGKAAAKATKASAEAREKATKLRA